MKRNEIIRAAAIVQDAATLAAARAQIQDQHRHATACEQLATSAHHLCNDSTESRHRLPSLRARLRDLKTQAAKLAIIPTQGGARTGSGRKAGRNNLTLSISIPSTAIAAMDRRRGTSTRSAWLRDLIHAATTGTDVENPKTPSICDSPATSGTYPPS